jgi:hypothetical protein
LRREAQNPAAILLRTFVCSANNGGKATEKWRKGEKAGERRIGNDWMIGGVFLC